MGNLLAMTTVKKFWWGGRVTAPVSQQSFSSEMMRAAEMGDTSKLKSLYSRLRGSLSKISCSHTGSTPLHSASAAGQGSAVKFLLNKGADPNAQDNGLETPLHVAAKSGSPECLLLLLRAHAKKEVIDAWGRTALLKAVVYNRPKCVYWLLDAGANTNVHDADGLSPLHVAASYGQVVLLRKLVKAGAKLNVVNRKGRLPLSKAIRNAKQVNIVEEMIRFGAQTYHGSHCVVKDAVQKLAQSHPAAKDSDNDNYKIVEIVISAHGYSLDEDVLGLFLSIYRSLDAKIYLPILMKLALISGQTSSFQLASHHVEQLEKFLPERLQLFSLKTLALRKVREYLMESGRNVVWATERLKVAPTLKRIILLEVIY